MRPPCLRLSRRPAARRLKLTVTCIWSFRNLTTVFRLLDGTILVLGASVVLLLWLPRLLHSPNTRVALGAEHAFSHRRILRVSARKLS
ncbi:hypothetical protein B0H12DRAFT_1158685, partial [Mycena haematopus]